MVQMGCWKDLMNESKKVGIDGNIFTLLPPLCTLSLSLSLPFNCMGMVYGVWCLVYGVWCMMYDVCCMMCMMCMMYDV